MPRLFELAGKDVLLLSPQGIKADGQKYLNLFQTGYFVGEYDYQKIALVMDHSSNLITDMIFMRLKRCFCPRWPALSLWLMDMWESDFPEKADGWAGALTFTT